MTENRKRFWYRVLIDVISYSLALLFVYAAASKLMEYDKFVVQIGQSAMLTRFAGLIAWLVPAVEILIAVMLVFERMRFVGLLASFGLMVMFTAYIGIILTLTDKMPCSCGGVLEKLGWGEHLVFNVSFTILGVIGVVLYRKLTLSARWAFNSKHLLVF